MFSKRKKNAKCQAIYNLLANDQGEETFWSMEEMITITKNLPQIQAYKQWRNLNFSEKKIKEWIQVGLKINEAELADKFRRKGYRPDSPSLKKTIIREAWRDVHPDFDYPTRKKWEKQRFSYKQTQEWINAGAKLNDYKFIAWLRDVKGYGLEWITNYQEDYQRLSERFKKYGLCPACNQPNTGEQWCRSCNNPRLQEGFTKWTSHNPQINEFIQKYQLQATDADKFLEWIPCEQFTEIEYLAEGGFGKVYKAKWTEGNVHHWDSENKEWQREKDHYYENKDKWGEDYYYDENYEQKQNKKSKSHREVVLKSLNNSQDNTDFLQETAKHKLIDDWFNNIVPCYGLSQDTKTGNYLMVMQYMPEGNLRKYLSNKNRELTLEDKISQLFHIAQGLKDIHSKNLVHRDFHSGNILKGIEKTKCLITDLGLCKPANETSKEDKIFGVMPYIAPEVLQSRPYAQASDIYSFGIIAYEMLTGLPPYYNREHGLSLGLDICQGLRPNFRIKIPPLLENLIKRCWDADPQKRPTANKLEKTLRSWQEGTNSEEEVYFPSSDYDYEYYEGEEALGQTRNENKSSEFKKQLQEAEEFNKNLPDGMKFPKYQIHQGAVYHSTLLPTKEIARLLQSSQELCGSSTISMTGLLDNLPNTSEENQHPEQQAQILHNPHPNQGDNH